MGGKRLMRSDRSPEGKGPSKYSESYSTGCQLSDLLRLLGKQHMLSILSAFCNDAQPLRFMELQKKLKMSPNTLSQRLRELVDAGLLTRTTFNEIPPRVNYAPTIKALALFTIFNDLGEWASHFSLESEPTPTMPAGEMAPAGK